MGFRSGAYATIWEVKPGNGNYTDARITISKKNRQTDQYEQDFGGYVRLIGTAHQNATDLQQKDRIKIGECDVSNTYNKEKNTTYTNFKIFTFDKVSDSGGTKGQNTVSNDTEFMELPDGAEEELPFN